MKSIRVFAVFALAVLLMGPVTAQTTLINGAGATFPFPIYSKWFSDYNKLHPNIQINYQSIGSGGGILQITNQTVFFGATDGPMTSDQLLAAPGAILHFPTVLGGVVPVYNIPGVRAELKFTGQILADIYLGRITRWDDAAIAKLNAGISCRPPTSPSYTAPKAPAPPISSRTTSARSPRTGRRGSGWPRPSTGPWVSAARGMKASPGWSSRHPGAIGYVELIYALQNKISYGSVQNSAGEFVRADVQSVTAAAAAAAGAMPKDFRVSITNAPGTGVYPISSFTWLLLYESPKDRATAKVMVDFMRWALTDGQKVRPGSWLCAAPPERRQDGTGRPEPDQVLTPVSRRTR